MSNTGPNAHASRGRPHAALPERRADNWEVLHTTFVREAREAGVSGRPRCRLLFLGDSITEAFRGTQFGETYDELKPRSAVFTSEFSAFGARAFGISGDRTQHLLWRVAHGELEFRHAPAVVVLCVGTNNLGRDGDGAEDTYLGILAIVHEVQHRLPGSRILLPGILPRGPGLPAPGSEPASMLPGGPGVSSEYASYTSRKSPGDSSPAPPDSSKFGQPGLFTATIHEVNRRLALLAQGSNGSVAYVDCEAPFLAPGGASLVPSLMRDALHPTAKGMTAWFQVLKPALAQLLALPVSRHLEVVAHGAHAEAAAAAAEKKGVRAKL